MGVVRVAVLFAVAVALWLGSALLVLFEPTLVFKSDFFSPDVFRKKYGPWAVVAGASRGLGRSWVRECAKRGLNVVALARNKAELDKTKQAVESEFPGVKVEPLILDLADTVRVAAVSQELARSREVGMLIYNAAMGSPGDFFATDFVYHNLTVQVNSVSMLSMFHAFAQPMMARKRGGIIIVGSNAGAVAGHAKISVYAATKAMQASFVDSMWNYMRKHNVDLLCSVLGATETDALLVMQDDKRNQLVQAMAPEEATSETFHAMGRGVASVVPGFSNKLSNHFLGFVPIPMRVPMIDDLMDGVYQAQEELDRIMAKAVKGSVIREEHVKERATS